MVTFLISHCRCSADAIKVKANLVGLRFGRLVALKESPVMALNRGLKWECVCDCGNKTVSRADSLLDGSSSSCGCGQREAAAATGRASRKRDLRAAALNKMFLRYAHNAKRNNREFSLSIEDFSSLVSSDCVYCGEAPKEVLARTGNFYGENHKIVDSGLRAHGIDRIDNSIGYVVDNCVSCCERCNRSKLTMTVDEFRDMISKQYNHFVNPEVSFSLLSMVESVDSLLEFYRKAA